MASTSTDIDVHPDEAWTVITDPTTYPRWLVGTRRILVVDAGFPAPGTAFRHEVGFGPLRLRDVSTVLECHARDRRLELRVRARPVIGVARVEMSVLLADEGRARVTIVEAPRVILGGRLFRPLADRLITARNARSLTNLRALLEGPRAIPEEPTPEAAVGDAAPVPAERGRGAGRAHRPRTGVAPA